MANKSKRKLGINIEGFPELLQRFNKLGLDYKKPLEDAVISQTKEISKNLHRDMKKHYRTGKTESSIVDEKPQWEGSMLTTQFGFNIKEGGLPSIFLMYGTPRMKKDTKLYNDVYGKAVKDGLRDAIENGLYDAIRKAGF